MHREFTLGGGDVLEFEREGEWVHSDLPQPDPEWRAADSNGHEHYASKTERGVVTYPTLKNVAGEPYWCADCEDDHQDEWRVCRRCGEEVLPGARIDATPKWMPLRDAYLLNGEPISRERANEIISEVRRAADEAAKVTSPPLIGERVRLGDATVTVVPTEVSVGDDRVTVMHGGTGAMETVSLEQLRKIR